MGHAIADVTETDDNANLGVEISVNRRPAGHGLNRRRTARSTMVIIVTSIYRVELKISIFTLYIHFKFTYYLCFYLRDYGRDLLLNYIDILFINLTIYFFLFVFLDLQLSRTYAPQALLTADLWGLADICSSAQILATCIHRGEPCGPCSAGVQVFSKPHTASKK